jgi:hypothetical protein
MLGIKIGDLYEVAEVMIQLGEWDCEFIICLQDVLKNNFGEFE